MSATVATQILSQGRDAAGLLDARMSGFVPWNARAWSKRSDPAAADGPDPLVAHGGQGRVANVQQTIRRFGAINTDIVESGAEQVTAPETRAHYPHSQVENASS
jgi:hypothetical protein